MHLVDGSCFRLEEVEDEVRRLYSSVGKDIYIIGVKCEGGLYADYYFDGEEELKFLYNCDGNAADRDVFLRACSSVMRHISSTTCCNVKSVYLDYLVLARALANRTLSGFETENLDDITCEYIPTIARGFKTSCETESGFKSIGPIGFYPIVPDSQWFERVASYGAKTIQLRIKDEPECKMEEEVGLCTEIASKYNARLIVNDHWKIALKYKAHGVHLGQDDLKVADLESIRKSDICLGISTHCYHELAMAMFHKPSYVAFGAIYGTTSKDMEFKAQDTSLLRRWIRYTSRPVVAIGGITLSNVGDVVRTGASGIAVISAITKAADPRFAVKEFLRACES